MFTKKITNAFAIITLLAINSVALSHDKVVVIPLGGDGIDINQCEVTRDCAVLAGVFSTTLSCASGEAVIPCVNRAVFVTSSLHQGNLGGLEGADAICNARATEAGLRGTFKAWLSNSTESVDSRFTKSTTPYVSIMGIPIANSFASITSSEQLLNPINTTETGVQISTNFRVWTNTRPNGSANVSNAINARFICQDWTSSAGTTSNGGTGDALSTTGDWTLDGSQECNQTARLYCFEQ